MHNYFTVLIHFYLRCGQQEFLVGDSVLLTCLCHLCLQLLPSHETPKVVQLHLGLLLPNTEPSPLEALTPPIGE